MLRLRAFLRTYWTRGVPDRPTPESVQVLMLRWWLVALLFKLLGSSWDVSWHFKWLRDDLAPPHLLNTVGTGIAIALILTHSFTGYGVDRLSLRIMQIGTAIFVLAAPIDIINHRVNGLDLTAWSPSHGMLYFGTWIMVIGVIRAFYLRYPRTGRFRWQWFAGMTALFVFLFEDTHFPQLQQEYGILEIGSWFRGTPYAEPTLLEFAANQLGRPVDPISLQHFALPIPAWVYPLWALVVTVPLLIIGRYLVGKVWTATAITGAYVLYRLITWPLLVLGGFPPSVPPFWMLGLGLAVDAVFLLKLHPYLRAVLGGLLVTAAGYGLLWLQTVASGTPTNLSDLTIEQMQDLYAGGTGEALAMPPVAFDTIWWAMPAAVLTWLFATWLVGRTVGFDIVPPPPLAITYSPEPDRDEGGLLLGVPYGSDPAGTSTPRKRVRTERSG